LTLRKRKEEMNMITPPQKIPILDLSGLTPFQRLNGNPGELTLQGSRVVALFDADKKFYEISERFNRNEPVPVLDLLHAQREIRAMMMALKQGHTEKEQGARNGNRKDF
jgi:hypothetical protein